MALLVDAAGTVKYRNGTYFGSKAAVDKLKAQEAAFNDSVARNKGPVQSTYTVQPGDTLSGIAAQADMSLADLARLNPTLFAAPRDPDLIRPDETVIIETDVPVSDRKLSTKPYTVKPGDDLNTIAHQHGWADNGALIALANGLAPGDALAPGQKLVIPVVESAPAPTPPEPFKPGEVSSVRAMEYRQQKGLEADAAADTVKLLGPAITALHLLVQTGGDDTAAARAWGATQLAIDNELRVAADGAEWPQDVPSAIERKAAEIKARLPEGSYARRQLDAIVDDSAARVAAESPATRNTRKAQYQAQKASRQVDQAQQHIDALNGESGGLREAELPGLQRALREAQAELAQAMGPFLLALQNEFALEAAGIEPNAPTAGPLGQPVYSNETLAQASASLKATYQGESLDVVIDGIALQQGYQGKVSVQLDRILRDDPTLNLTEYEQKLAKEDPVSLAMILAAGGRIDPEGLPGLNNEQLHDAKMKADSDPVGFGLEQIAKAGFNPANPAQQMQVLALQSATADVRLAYTGEQVGEKMGAGDEQGALTVLTTNLDAAASLQERQMLWEQVGLNHFGRDWVDNNLERLTTEAPGQPLNHPHAKTRYLDRVGMWLQGFDAPPELANLLLDRIKEDFDEGWYDADDSAGMSGDYGGEFYKGLSNMVEHADRPLFGQPGEDRASEFARWLNDPSSEAYNVMLGISGREGNSLESAITEGIAEDGRTHGSGLTDALLGQLKNGGAPHGTYLDDPARIDAIERGAAAGKRQALANGNNIVAQRQFEFFEKNKQESIDVYFDPFLKDAAALNTPRKLKGVELRDFIAKSIGLEPKAYDPESPEGRRIAAIERQIIETENLAVEHGDEMIGITMIPMLYVSMEEGVQDTALFRLQIRFNTDHEKKIDDNYHTGSEFAPPPLDDYTERAGKAQENGENQMDFLIGDRAEGLDEEARAGRYDSLEHLLDDGPYADQGKLYLPRDLELSAKENGHAEVVSFDSNNADWWDKHGDALVGVITAGAGLVLMVSSGGLATPVVAGSLAVVGGGTAYGAVRSVQMLEDLDDRGQSLSLSNPEARSAWLNLASSAVGATTVASGIRGYNLIQAGQRAANSGSVAQGQFLFDRGKRLTTISGAADLTAGGVVTADQLLTMSEYGLRASPLDTLLIGVAIGQMGAGAWLLRQGLRIELEVGPASAPQTRAPALPSAKPITVLTLGRDGGYRAGRNPEEVYHDPAHPVIGDSLVEEQGGGSVAGADHHPQAWRLRPEQPVPPHLWDVPGLGRSRLPSENVPEATPLRVDRIDWDAERRRLVAEDERAARTVTRPDPRSSQTPPRLARVLTDEEIGANRAEGARTHAEQEIAKHFGLPPIEFIQSYSTIRARVRDDHWTYVLIDLKKSDLADGDAVEVLAAYAGEQQPLGTTGRLFAATLWWLQNVHGLTPKVLVGRRIENEPTLEAWLAHGDPRKTVLGRWTDRTLSLLGAKVEQYDVIETSDGERHGVAHLDWTGADTGGGSSVAGADHHSQPWRLRPEQPVPPHLWDVPGLGRSRLPPENVPESTRARVDHIDWDAERRRLVAEDERAARTATPPDPRPSMPAPRLAQVLTDEEIGANRRNALRMLEEMAEPPFDTPEMSMADLADQCSRSETLMALLSFAHENQVRIANRPGASFHNYQGEHLLPYGQVIPTSGGASYSPSKKLIVMDPAMLRPHYAIRSRHVFVAEYALRLAHELSHVTDLPALAPSDFSDLPEYTINFLDEELGNEGRAVMREYIVGYEMGLNGGKIANSQSSPGNGEYGLTFGRYKSGEIDDVDAVRSIASLISQSVQSTDASKTYGQAYSERAEYYWNKYQSSEGPSGSGKAQDTGSISAAYHPEGWRASDEGRKHKAPPVFRVPESADRSPSAETVDLTKPHLWNLPGPAQSPQPEGPPQADPTRPEKEKETADEFPADNSAESTISPLPGVKETAPTPEKSDIPVALRAAEDSGLADLTAATDLSKPHLWDLPEGSTPLLSEKFNEAALEQTTGITAEQMADADVPADPPSIPDQVTSQSPAAKDKGIKDITVVGTASGILTAIWPALPPHWSAPINAGAYALRGLSMLVRASFPSASAPDKLLGRVLRASDVLTFLPNIANGATNAIQLQDLAVNGSFQVGNLAYATLAFRELRTGQRAFPNLDKWALPLYGAGSVYYTGDVMLHGGTDLSGLPGAFHVIPDALGVIPGGADTIAGALFAYGSAHLGYEAYRPTIRADGKPAMTPRIVLGVTWGGGLLLFGGLAAAALLEKEDKKGKTGGDSAAPPTGDSPPPETPGPDEPATPEPQPQVVVTAQDGVNLRAEPTMLAERLTVLRPGSLIHETGPRHTDAYGDRWVAVEGFGLDGERYMGWVIAKYLKPHERGVQTNLGRANPELEQRGYRWIEVQPGQTIGDVARAQSRDVADTVLLNMDHIDMPHLIFAGDRVYLPA